MGGGGALPPFQDGWGGARATGAPLLLPPSTYDNRKEVCTY